jgi:acetolactate synthase I/III small subunit
MRKIIMKHKHIISMIVEDSPGVLTKITGLFMRRNFNIDTITVGKTLKPGISKVIISIIGEDNILEQVEKQCNKLIDVIKVQELHRDTSLIRETCLIKVSVRNDKVKSDLIKYTEIYNAKIVDIIPKQAILEICDDPGKVESFIELVKQYGIKELSRSGITGISKLNNQS